LVTADDGVETGYAFSTAQVPEQVGGDFLDMVSVGDKLVLVSVGDVKGHGLQTARLATLARGSLRILARAGYSPAQALLQLNAALRSDVLQGQVVATCVALLDIESRTLKVASAGHYPPVILSGTKPSLLELPSLPTLGAVDDPGYTELRVELPPGDTLVVYTDGIAEAGAGGKEFGVERLLSILSEHNKARAQAIADGIMHAVVSFSGEALIDDATVGVLRLRD
jgi:phosphoserine phosphatase RsbU/P